MSQTVTLHGLCLLFQKAGKDTQPYTYDFTGRPSQDPPPQPGAVGEVEETNPPQGAPGSGGQISLTQRRVPKPVRFLGLP